MTNLPELSARARRALDVLADGGVMVRRLETNHFGRAKWTTRFCRNASWSSAVRGLGPATRYELEAAGFRFRVATDRPSSSVATCYRLAKD